MAPLATLARIRDAMSQCGYTNIGVDETRGWVTGHQPSGWDTTVTVSRPGHATIQHHTGRVTTTSPTRTSVKALKTTLHRSLQAVTDIHKIISRFPSLQVRDAITTDMGATRLTLATVFTRAPVATLARPTITTPWRLWPANPNPASKPWADLFAAATMGLFGAPQCVTAPILAYQVARRLGATSSPDSTISLPNHVTVRVVAHPDGTQQIIIDRHHTGTRLNLWSKQWDPRMLDAAAAYAKQLTDGHQWSRPRDYTYRQPQ